MPPLLWPMYLSVLQGLLEHDLLEDPAVVEGAVGCSEISLDRAVGIRGADIDFEDICQLELIKRERHFNDPSTLDLCGLGLVAFEIPCSGGG